MNALRCAVIVAMLAASAAPALADDVAQRKEAAVRTALEKQGRGDDNAALIASSSRAHAITDVKMAGTPDAPEIVIETAGRPAYEWFKLDSGKRIVIDIHNTIHLQSGQKLAPIGAASVQRVRTSLFATEPEFVSRVVVDLRDIAQPEFSQQDDRIVVRLRSAAAGKTPARESDAAMRIAADLSQAQQQIGAHKQRMEESLASAAVPAEGVPQTDALRAFIEETKAANAALLAKIAAAADTGLAPLGTQRDRLDELQAALFAGAIGDEKAKTTLDSILSEIKTATANADTALAGVEKEIDATVQPRANRIAELKTEETVVLAAADEPAAEPAPVAAETEVVAAVVEPASAGTTANVETTISQIQQDLAAISAPQADAPAVAPDSAVVPVETVTETKPLDPAVLARLDGLTSQLDKLQHDVFAPASTMPSSAAPVDSSADAPLASTESVSIDLMNSGTPETVSAIVQPTEAPSAKPAEESVQQPIVLAQATETPEPETTEEASEPDASAPGDEAPVSEPPATESEAPSESVPAEPAPAEPTPSEPAATEPAAIVEPVAPQAPPKIIAAPTPAERETLPAGMDPLDQIVNIDFREMDLSSVVSLLAKKGQVNVIAGTEVTGTVTADIRNVPLRKAMDMVLRMNGLGIVEEEGIFRITTYEEAVSARRSTRMVVLGNAQSEDVRMTLEGILVGGRDAKIVTVAANKNTNTLIISGPEDRVIELERLARELDIAEPILPTITEAIKVNYLDPTKAKPIVETMKTDKIGKVEVDQEGRHIIVTDVPAAVEQMRALLATVDKPVKQVAIEAMIVDAVLRDASQTGVDWTLEAIRRFSSNGDLVSDVSNLQFDGNLGAIGSDNLNAGILQLGILSSEVRLNATIAAEAQSRNAEILANPSVVTVENQMATISIVQEFPYQEITQGLTGPPVASTEFKPIGVTLEVTPRITHANDTIVEIQAKQSSVSGLTESGVPIEDKREAQTTLRAENGRTIFIGGLRNVSDRLDVSKIPVLGDIPVLSFMFRNTTTEKVNTELLIFLTCHVLEENLPDLSASQLEAVDKLDSTPKVPDAQRANFHDIVQPQDMRDPMWKWRRSNR